jgi:hypothetical protein
VHEFNRGGAPLIQRQNDFALVGEEKDDKRALSAFESKRDVNQVADWFSIDTYEGEAGVILLFIPKSARVWERSAIQYDNLSSTSIRKPVLFNTPQRR